jgi:hypothetical protein
MTTAHHQPTSTSSAGTHRGVTALGTFLVALPLLGGIVAALMALGGRFGGPDNVLTTLWYVPMAIAWLAVPGASILLLVHRHDRHLLQPLAIWTALAAGGWVFAIGSAQVTGLAGATSTDGMTWQILVMATGIAAFVIGLVGLTATGVRAGSPPEDDFY